MPPPVAYGVHAVRILLARHPERLRRVLLGAGRDAGRLAGIRSLAVEAGVTVSKVDDATLDQLAGGGRHQGVVAELVARAVDPETLLAEALDAARGPPLLLVLDGVQDPHNLGACLRSADAAGATAVIAPRDRAAGLTPVVRKVAAGAAETVPFVPVVNLARALRDLKERGLWIIGTDDGAGQGLYQADFTGPVAVVLGSEGEGMRRLTRDCCDLLVSIPMAGAVESLNVSVAAGIVLFEAVRQRQEAAGRGSVQDPG